MPPTAQILATSVGLSILLQRFTPQYSLGIVAGSILLFFVLFTTYVAYAVVLYPHYFSPLRHLPEPPNGHFIWGQTKRIRREASGMPMRDWIENVPNNGLIRYSMYLQERLLVTSPSVLSEVLVTKNYDFIKPPMFKNGLGQITGIGILLAEGDEHKIQRKNLLPAFAFRHVKDIYPVFWAKSRELVAHLTNAITPSSDIDTLRTKPQNTVDVKEWSSRATLDIIGVSGMGQDFNSLQDPSNKLYQTYQTVFKTGRTDGYLRLMQMVLPYWIVKRIPIKRNQEMQAATGYIKQVCRDLIARKRQVIAEKGKSEVDILSTALDSGVFEDENLVNQMMTFMVAGHETTATAMIWAMYLLSKHQDVQQKLRSEVRERIPSLQQDITASDIDNCHYLQAVCTEILRLWPPVSMTMRIAAKNTTIAGEFIPKGTMIILTPWAINTSKQLWGPDALEFKPERWIDANGKANNQGSATSNFSFLTFLHGPRSCIGEKFSRAEFACLVAAWIGSFETSFEQGSPLEHSEPDVLSGVTAKPKGGLWCQLKEVPGW